MFSLSVDLEKRKNTLFLENRFLRVPDGMEVLWMVICVKNDAEWGSFQPLRRCVWRFQVFASSRRVWEVVNSFVVFSVKSDIEKSGYQLSRPYWWKVIFFRAITWFWAKYSSTEVLEESGGVKAHLLDNFVKNNRAPAPEPPAAWAWEPAGGARKIY